LSIKLFKVETNAVQGGKGDKKYSLGFDVYDVTARIYSKKAFKMIDVEEQEIKKAKSKQEKKKENVGGTRTQT